MLRMTSSTLNAEDATLEKPVEVSVELREQLLCKLESIESFPATISVPASNLNVWSWLNANAGLPRIVWSDRESSKKAVDACSDIVAGVGVASGFDVHEGDDLSSVTRYCRELLNGNTQIRFFGGFSFDGNAGWETFGAGRFVAPRFLLQNGELQLTVMDRKDIDNAKLDLQRLNLEPAGSSADLPSPVGRKDSPTVDGWQSNVDEALSFIRCEVLEKIVLARKSTLEFAEPLNPITLTSRIFEATHDCFVFCFDFGSDTESPHAFLGATPERLFARDGNLLRSEVVAGTRKRGATSGEDQRLAYELLTSDKDQLEHDIVRKSIRQKLHKFVDQLDVDSHASVLRLARKQHLCSEVQGTLKEGVEDGDLLKRLHPTPAVGGYPTENALPEIARLEPFDRGWYAAPLGWISAENAEFVVGIRSGLVEGNLLSLYSGAGIVRGSDPDEEWREVENKIQDFLEILG